MPNNVKVVQDNVNVQW